MNLEKYTQKAQEALLAAQQLAQNYQHQVVEPAHLLLALIQQEDGIIPALVTKVAGGTSALESEIKADLVKAGQHGWERRRQAGPLQSAGLLVVHR